METDLLTLVEQDGFRSARKPAMSRGGQYNGPCPWCGGDDRFRVQPNYGTYGWFACSQCSKKGNAVDYLMLKRGFSKWEALTTVGWAPKETSEKSAQSSIPQSAYQERPQWNEPPKQWQEAAMDFYQMCKHTLWSTQGKAALDYLRQRGFTDEIIKATSLGYHASESIGIARVWGRAVKLPQGIVIPWFLSNALWRVTVRDERVIEGPGRYKQLAGGSNGLYLADSPKRLKKTIVVLVEGEFDALSVIQQCRDLVAVVATGTTQGSHTPRWVSLLAQQERVLVAFDAEDKGDIAAQWWLQRLANAERLRPWWSDANQMLQDGVDLRQWIESALQQVDLQEPEIATTCSICGANFDDASHYDEQGTLYCGKHWHSRIPVRTQQQDVPEQKQPVEIIQPTSQEQRLEQYAKAVSSVASVFPGKCQILPAPQETTLAEWLAHQPRKYTPCLLPKLPRSYCPFEVSIERQRQIPHTKQYIRVVEFVPCKEKPLANGWCAKHQLSQELLNLGAQLGYPHILPSPHRGIQDGVGTWEEHVVRARQTTLQGDIAFVKSLIEHQNM